MFKHYLTTALRFFGRNKFGATLNVLCLTMGMTCFAAAYGVVAWFTNTDRHYLNSARTYFVTERLTARGINSVTPAVPQTSWVVGNVLRADSPAALTVARLTPGGEAAVAADGKSAFASTAFADPEFLEIFNLPFVEGDAKVALRAPHSAIVTKAMAERVFGSSNVVGKTLLLSNRESVAITGVVAEFKQPSHFGNGAALIQFEMLISMDTYESLARATSSPAKLKEKLGTWGANMGTFTYVLAKDGSTTQDTLNTWLEAAAKRHAPTEEGTFHLAAQPIWQLYSSLGDAAVGTQTTGISSTTVLLTLGGLILLVSCVNYANLATAQITSRTREFAMRRVVGAGRAEIVHQYLFETALIALAALILVFAFAVLTMSVLGAVIGINVLGTVLLSPKMWLVLASTLAVVTLVAGAYPALVLSRVSPLRALHASHRSSGPRFVPTVLVGVQFGAASFLLIALLVMQSQNNALKRQRAAAAGEPIVAVTTSVREAGIDIQVLRSELLRSEYIETVAASGEIPGGLSSFDHRIVGRSLDASAARHFVSTTAVDQYYFDTMKIGLLAGRPFDSSRRDAWDQNTARSEDTMNVIINRAMAEQSGWPDPNQAIDQTIYGHAGLGEHALAMHVIGVVENRPLALLGYGTLANMYTLESERAVLPIIRLSKTHTQEGIAALEATWKKLSPNVPLRRIFLDESFERTYRILPMISNTFAALALFAFAISAMGLVGMATHVTARRTREIGVRKTLGASVAKILGLLLRDFSKPVIIANIIIWPLAYVVMKGYLSMFMVHAELNAVPFVSGLAITAVIACLSVVVQASRAARMNPATVLRCE